MVSSKKHLKNDLIKDFNYLNLISRVNEVDKNVRMIISAMTHEKVQNSFNKTDEYLTSKMEKIIRNFIQFLYLFLGCIIGILISKEMYPQLFILFGVCCIIFCIQIISTQSQDRKFKRNKTYKDLRFLQKENDGHMIKLIS